MAFDGVLAASSLLVGGRIGIPYDTDHLCLIYHENSVPMVLP